MIIGSGKKPGKRGGWTQRRSS